MYNVNECCVCDGAVAVDWSKFVCLLIHRRCIRGTLGKFLHARYEIALQSLRSALKNPPMALDNSGLVLPLTLLHCVTSSFACNWLTCLLKVGSHCWSDQLDRPDRPNSPTKLDQSRPLLGRGTVRDLFPTESAGVWLSSDRVAVELIGYWSVQKRYPDHTRSLHNYLPIKSTSTRPIADRFLSTWLLDCCWTFKNNRVGNPIDADHPDHLPYRACRLIGLDQVDLIGSGNPPLTNVYNVKKSDVMFSSFDSVKTNGRTPQFVRTWS